MKKEPVHLVAAVLIAASAGLFLSVCSRAEPVPKSADRADETLHPEFSLSLSEFEKTVSGVPPEIRKKLLADPLRFLELFSAIRAQDPYLTRLVDKKNLLPSEYEPDDLKDLRELKLKTSRKGLLLREAAARALAEMSEEAKTEGITLLVSSAYRSYSYQKGLYERNVKEMGQAAADRESARPGSSQHQLGTAVDFGSISDAFTGTPMELWLKKNAGKFGFSLSYPEGFEEVTGYRHESWHFRFVGPAAASMEAEFFGGIQQRMLEFLSEKSRELEKFRNFKEAS